MAAVLKKRVLAEYTQVIQEDPKQPASKKLRLVHRPKPFEVTLDLQNASSPQEVSQQLLNLEETFPIPLEQVALVLHSLTEHLEKEKETFNRAKIAWLIAEIVKIPGYDSIWLVDKVSTTLRTESSQKVVRQLLNILNSVGLAVPSDTHLHKKLLNISIQYLQSRSHLVRSQCLYMIGVLGLPDVESQSTPSPSTSATNVSAQSLLLKHTKDDDSRVRSIAFQALISWHQRGIKLKEYFYQCVCDALTDDYEKVRLAAMKLIWILSHSYPESIVKVEDSDERIRLVDDGFAKICHMVNDSSMAVRAEAAGLLGSLHQVSQRFLEQTLDKKLMSNMRRKVTAHERQKEHFTKGEWATGQKWADDAPKEELDEEEVTVMASGSCGAFVHGLEDEYLEVRMAAIDSVCELATQSAYFAQLSQDFLIDMFNDEIDRVRLNAISSLCKIGQHLLLREDQLEIILGVLKDFSPDVRESTHEMLSAVKLATKTCLNTCAMMLLDNLRLYPEDHDSVWRCMKALGRNHSSLTLTLVPDLLSYHPYFDSFEPEMDDPAYISILILVFNAAEINPSMCPSLLDHTVRHYTYLRNTMPELVPELKLFGSHVANRKSQRQEQNLTHVFMEQTFERLQSIEDLKEEHVLEMMKMTLRDLNQVAEVEPSLQASAELMSLFLKCQLNLTQLLSGNHWTSIEIANTVEGSRNTTMINQVLEMSHQMEHLYIGLSRTELVMVRQVRLRAQTLQLLARLRCSQTDSKHACVQFLQMLNQLQRYLTLHSLKADSFTSSALSELHRLESCDPSIFLPVLQGTLAHHMPSVLQLSNHVLRCKAMILEPTASEDKVYKFTAGFAVSVLMRVDLENLEKLENIRIQLKYPDQKIRYIIPQSADFRQLSPLRYKLITKVVLSHDIWSDVGNVEMSVVLCYNPNQDLTGAKAEPLRLEASKSTVLSLCKPVKVQIQPTALKKS